MRITSHAETLHVDTHQQPEQYFQSTVRFQSWTPQMKQQVVSEKVFLEADMLWMGDDLPNQLLLELLIYRTVRKIKLFQANDFGSNLFHSHN